MSKPTIEQMERFWALLSAGVITLANLQTFLERPDRFLGLLTTYDASLGLIELMEWAVGSDGWFNDKITSERFSLEAQGNCKERLRVEPFLYHETEPEAAKRLIELGYGLVNIGSLCGFLHNYPDEVAKWENVFVIGDKSKWCAVYGVGKGMSEMFMPCVKVSSDSKRRISLHRVDMRFTPRHGILVACK